MIVAARAAGDARAAGSAIRAAIQSVDRDVPIPAFHTMDDVLGESVAQQRFQMLLAGVFAAAALLLSALGIYGVVAYSVARRQKELGIRIALGATPTAIHALVLRHGMRPVLFGLVVGLATALAGGRVLNSLLFETRASDPFTLAMVAATLTLIALGACYLPGRHATHVNPVEALRAE
jgi:putative ABC transport system permease protein